VHTYYTLTRCFNANHNYYTSIKLLARYQALAKPTAQSKAPPPPGGARGTGGWGKGGSDTRNRSVNSQRTGSDFASKRAGGDVRRKGQKLEPYAYIPLDAKVRALTTV
jgi:hypothetical protein